MARSSRMPRMDRVHRMTRARLFYARPFSREWVIGYTWVILGSLVMAAGYNLMIIPHNVVPGGLIGVAQLINQLTGLPIGLTAAAFNIPLVVYASRVMGPGFGIKTVVAIAVSAVGIDVLAQWRGIEPVIPDILVSTVFGGVLIGLAVAMIIRGKGNAGGTAVVAQLVSRWTRTPPGRCMLYIDGLVVLGSMVVFQDLAAAPYAIIGIFTVSRAVDAVLNGLDATRALMIVSERHQEICEVILHGLGRTGTVLTGHGLFADDRERRVILTALSRRDTVLLQKRIRDLDPQAFCMVLNTAEVLGTGFRSWR